MKPFLFSAALLALFGQSASAQDLSQGHVHGPAAATPAAAVSSPPPPAPVLTPPSRSLADIKTADGKTIGIVALQAATSGVLLRVDGSGGLTPGWHGMHFHQTADCSDPKFLTSGAHMNHAEGKRAHGLLNPGGPDFGDLVNLYVAADGSGHAEAYSPLVRLDPGSGDAQTVLHDADGSALVIHANGDDHLNQPIGGAGARVACAVIK